MRSDAVLDTAGRCFRDVFYLAHKLHFVLLVVFTGSGAVLTDWETEAFGLLRKYTAPVPPSQVAPS